MAFIVNPMSRRLGYSCFWNMLLSSSSLTNYSFLNISNYCLIKLVNYCIELLRLWHLISVRTFFLGTRLLRIRNYIHIVLVIRMPDDLRVIQKNQSNLLLEGYLVYGQSFRFKKYFKQYLSLLKLFFFFIKFFNFNKEEVFNITWKLSLFNYILQYIKLESLKNSWFLFLKYLLRKFFNKNIKLWINYVSLGLINSSYLVDFLKVKLIQKYPVYLIINIILRTLTSINIKYNIFYGIKINVAGRFTRKERKLYWWISKGAIDYSNLNANLDYSSSNVILLNSLCGIKVWLNLTHKFKKSRLLLI